MGEVPPECSWEHSATVCLKMHEKVVFGGILGIKLCKVGFTKEIIKLIHMGFPKLLCNLASDSSH